jgi:hypothetical protein
VLDTGSSIELDDSKSSLAGEYFFHNDHYKARVRRKIIEQKEKE